MGSRFPSRRSKNGIAGAKSVKIATLSSEKQRI